MDYKKKVIALLNSQELSNEQKEKLESIFPELKESEDDRIKKVLIDYFKWYKEYGIKTFYDIPSDDVLAWVEKQGEHANFRNSIQVGDKVTRNEDGVLVNLSQLNRVAKKDERQGEQKPDMVEPKFKDGDWVVYDGWTCQITDVKEDGYCNNHNGFIPKDREDDMRLWTIQDAKDGDVLAASDGSIFLFKGTIDCACKHYVALTTDGAVKSNEGLEHFWETSIAVHPATKEQRDQLEKAISDAGYTFDFEKKELKKIEQKPAEWSEEDERMFNSALWHVKNSCGNQGKNSGEFEVYNWLKSLKDRVQPQKQEWSEDDACKIDKIVKVLDYVSNNNNLVIGQIELEDLKNWLKSLRPQKQWKPSDEQMDALLKLEEMHVLEHEKNQENAHLYMVIKSIREQLLKLREE